MAVTAVPVLTVGSRLAPYIAANGDKVLPGCYGVSHGGRITGELIRHVTGAWGGHAFVYIGNGQIIEAAPPVVRLAPASSHPDAVWNANYPLTGLQRDKICARARALAGCPYDYPAYVGFALKVLKLRDGAELDPVFKADHWRVCSALVADCYAYAGIKVPNLYNMIARPA
jgi:uncharacterized protein YycO